jgi:hypothetical protein
MGSRLDRLYYLAEERRSKMDSGGGVPPELWQPTLFYLTDKEKEEAHNLKMSMPTFGQLRAEAIERLKNRKRGRK